MSLDPQDKRNIPTGGEDKNLEADAKKNLEFDFQATLSPPPQKPEPTTIPSSTYIPRPSGLRSTVSPGKQGIVETTHKSSPEPSPAVPSKPEFTSNPQKPIPMSNPPFSQYQQNVQRQSREQKAVGSILSGVAITLIASIVLVAFLAGYGGWTLSMQIKEQSVTINGLQSKTDGMFRNLNEDLKAIEKTNDELNSANQAQRQRLATLQSQFEQIQVQYRKDRATDQFKLQKLESRLFDLERREAQGR